MAAIARVGADGSSNEKAVNHLLMVYINSGNTDSAISTLSKYESEGHVPSVSMRNSILSAIVHAPGLLHGDLLDNYWDHYGGVNESADTRTYHLALSACEKYGRLDDAVKWFDHLLASGLNITLPLVDILHRTLGDSAFEEYKSKLAVNAREVIESVGEKQHRQLGDDSNTESIAVIPVSKSWSLRNSVTSDDADAGADAESTLSTREDDKPKAQRARLAICSRRGDSAATEALIAEMKRKGKPLKIAHYNYLLHSYAICKDPVNARRVADECRNAGIKLNLKSMQFLSTAYSRAFDSVGAQQILQEALDAGLKPGVH